MCFPNKAIKMSFAGILHSRFVDTFVCRWVVLGILRRNLQCQYSFGIKMVHKLDFVWRRYIIPLLKWYACFFKKLLSTYIRQNVLKLNIVISIFRLWLPYKRSSFFVFLELNLWIKFGRWIFAQIFFGWHIQNISISYNKYYVFFYERM